VDAHKVSWYQLAASAGFYFAVHVNGAALDQQFGLSAGIGNSLHFQELIEAQFSLGVVHLRIFRSLTGLRTVAIS
jgi:hypothetical protein